MARAAARAGWALLLTLVVASAAQAQEGEGGAKAKSAKGKGKKGKGDVVAEGPKFNADTVKLVFDREVFGYAGAGRRDPFTPLTGKGAAAMGPRFQDLKLTGVIYVPGDGRASVATVEDADGKKYRVRRGDVVGNTRIVDIGARRVVVIVQNFGLERREVLDIQRKAAAEEGTT
ncbi:MAG TPA: hypothetical protein VEI02_05330 [Planctomycetota bacterium]|nr:hypothetical protein [Planctomycetota bacterium]